MTWVNNMKIGIDPGNTGAVVFMSMDDEVVAVHDMPLMPNGKKQQVNAAALSAIVSGSWAENTVMAYVEKVSAMPGQGVSSMFNFGMGYGVIQGVLAANNIPYTLVTPQSWKKRAGLIGKDKDMSRTMAQQMYPKAELHRKKDIGRADAILIARYGDK